MDKVVQKMMQYQMKVTSIIDLHSKAEDGKNLDLRLFNIDFSQHNWKVSMLWFVIHSRFPPGEKLNTIWWGIRFMHFFKGEAGKI